MGIKHCRRHIRVQVISKEDKKVNIEETDFYREMEVNRSGNLLEAARIKAGFSQKQLAETVGIRQTMISEYENGRTVRKGIEGKTGTVDVIR